MRVPYWVPRTLFGYAVSAAMGLLVFGLIVFVPFEGRTFSEIPCATSSCFQSRNLEAATAFALALVSGTWIGTRLESVRLSALNGRGLEAARGTEATYYGPLNADIAAFLDDLPRLIVAGQQATVGIAPGSDDAVQEAMTKAVQSAFKEGQALALNVYVERAQTAALSKLNEVAPLVHGPTVRLTLSAVAILVGRDYMSRDDFLKVWRLFEGSFGQPPPSLRPTVVPYEGSFAKQIGSDVGRLARFGGRSWGRLRDRLRR